jgi:nucleoid-associated protein YgaU
MSDQKPVGFMWKTVLGIWLCGALIYLQMGGFEELQSLLGKPSTPSEQAAMESPQAAKDAARSAPPPVSAPSPVPKPAKSRQAGETGQPPAVAEAASSRLPSVDVARAEASGEVVIAGSAEPGWTVRVENGSQTLGQTQADGSGSWVLMPDKPLSPGEHSLSVIATSPDGRPPLRGANSATIKVPERNLEKNKIVENAERRAVAGVEDAKPVDPRPRAEAGASGSEPSKSEAPKIEAPSPAATPGSRTLTTESLKSGQALASREEGRRSEAGRRKGRRPARRRYVTVNPGDSLWRIARKYYGRGASYNQIYRFNRDQINDPDRIYPNQRFLLSR